MQGLAARQDTGFKPTWSSLKEVEEEETKRLLQDALMALAAAGQPRRLGGDAEREDLARDRKISRKAANAFLVCLRPYGAMKGDWRALIKRASANDEARQAGAQVVWETFIPERVSWLEQRAAQVARFAIMKDEIQWGNRAVFRLDREKSLLEDAWERTR